MNALEPAYTTVLSHCKTIFQNKLIDYGASWRVLRTLSVVDQIFIKALRIKNIQTTKQQQIDDTIFSEFQGITNYGLIALIQLQLAPSNEPDIDTAKAIGLYEQQAQQALQLALKKNADYNNAWQAMSIESFVDLILVKLLRIKQILNNQGSTLISEGMDANFIDIVNYAVLAQLVLNQPDS